MFNMLLVDDEIDQVDVLADTIDWSKAGISQVYKAYSAMEALELVEIASIDIVVTDIRMPEMSGLDLARQLTERGVPVQAIILSGYSDFAYAQTAMKYNVSEYLLKPVNDAEILEAVERSCRRIREEREAARSKQEQARWIYRKLPVIRSNLLNELLNGKRLTQADLGEMEEDYGIRCKQGDIVHQMLIRLEDKFIRYTSNDQDLIKFSIQNMTEEMFGREFEMWSTRDPYGYLVILLKNKEYMPSVPSRIRQLADRLRQAVQSYLGGNITVLLSGSFRFWEELQETYRENVSVFRNIIGDLEGKVITAQRLRDMNVPAPSPSHVQRSASPSQLIESGYWSQAIARLEDIVDELVRQRPYSHDRLLEVIYAFSHAVVQYVHANGLTLRQIDDEQERLSNGSTQFQTARQFQEWAVGIIGKLRELKVHAEKSDRSRLVEVINRYIEAHYGEDSTLQSLSDYIGMHPAYLSKLYKSETGIGISEYRHKLRMEKAVELLKQDQYKIHEISEWLGYQNPQYFSKRFKEEYGCTPNEFRERKNI